MSAVSFDLTGRVALVTGSSRSIGRSLADGLAGAGATVVLNGVDRDRLDATRADFAARHTAAKGGLRNLTRAMAAEWGTANVQANSIAPGYIHTEMTQNLVDDRSFNAWVLGRTPAARWGCPADLVGPTIWLASDASGYVNGQTIFVDGGMTAVV